MATTATVTRAILEDRYDGLLEVVTLKDRPFTDSSIGDANARWLKFSKLITEITQATARDGGADGDCAILARCHASIREHVITGILEAQAMTDTTAPTPEPVA